MGTQKGQRVKSRGQGSRGEVEGEPLGSGRGRVFLTEVRRLCGAGGRGESAAFLPRGCHKPPCVALRCSALVADVITGQRRVQTHLSLPSGGHRLMRNRDKTHRAVDGDSGRGARGRGTEHRSWHPPPTGQSQLLKLLV